MLLIILEDLVVAPFAIRCVVVGGDYPLVPQDGQHPALFIDTGLAVEDYNPFLVSTESFDFKHIDLDKFNSLMCNHDLDFERFH